jgi:hypothetical protein
MHSTRTAAAFLTALAVLLSAGITAQQPTRFALVTSSGTIGTLTVTEDGRSVDTVYRVDENGRGPKLTEHVELGPDGLPRRWDIQGSGWFGAQVKESFIVENGRAKWTSLDDRGEADARGAVYIANNGTPWALSLYLKALLSTRDSRRAALPGGTIRAEVVQPLHIGSDKGGSRRVRHLGS